MDENLSFKNLSIYKSSSLKVITDGIYNILSNRRFLLYVLTYMFSMGVLFTNIASAPFIMQEHYGLSTLHFSIVFGFNALTFAIAAALIPRFKDNDAAIRFGTFALAGFSVLTAVVLFFKPGFWWYEILVFILMLMVGIVSTASNVSAMDSGRDNAGVASALLGAIGYAFGGIVPAIVGMGDMFITTGALFFFSSMFTLVCVLISLAGKKSA